jgi:hypothetical protein
MTNGWAGGGRVWQKTHPAAAGSFAQAVRPAGSLVQSVVSKSPYMGGGQPPAHPALATLVASAMVLLVDGLFH